MAIGFMYTTVWIVGIQLSLDQNAFVDFPQTYITDGPKIRLAYCWSKKNVHYLLHQSETEDGEFALYAGGRGGGGGEARYAQVVKVPSQ